MRITEARLRKLIKEMLEGDPEAPRSWAWQAMQSGDSKQVKSPGLELIHRSPREISIDDLDAETPRMSKQAHRGSGARFVGVYTYEQGNDADAGRKFGEHEVVISIPLGTPYLDLVGTGINTSRITDDAAAELRGAGYSLVRGKDFIGPPEWIILDNRLLR